MFPTLGTGVGTTVMEIADAVERRSGHPLERILAGRREGDPSGHLRRPQQG